MQSIARYWRVLSMLHRMSMRCRASKLCRGCGGPTQTGSVSVMVAHRAPKSLPFICRRMSIERNYLSRLFIDFKSSSPPPPPLPVSRCCHRCLPRANIVVYRIIRGRTQSGHAPEPCTLMEAGGWAPPSTHHGFNEESEDVFTCFLDWEMEEARAAWYHNLINSVMAYDEIGRCMDELKMLAECGVESRIILAKDRF